MKVSSISQAFDLSNTVRGGGWFSAALSLAMSIAAVLAGYLHFDGRFQLPEEFAALPFVLPFDELCVGIALYFFISGIQEFFRFSGYRVDPLKKTIQHITKGVFGTRYGVEIQFNDLKYVEVFREVSGTRSTRIPVYIHLKSDARKQVFLSDRYAVARVYGEKLAKLTNVDFHDTEAGETVVRKPEELDETVRDKLRKQSSHRLSPNTPPRMHSKVKVRFEALTIDIPHFKIASLGRMNKVLWVMFVIFAGWTAIALYFESYVFACVGASFWIVPLYAIMRSETITLTRDTLAVRSGIGFLKITQRIPFSELEELYLTKAMESESEEADTLYKEGQIKKDILMLLKALVAIGSAIIARSDRKSITFGRILSHVELEYILYQVERWVRK